MTGNSPSTEAYELDLRATLVLLRKNWAFILLFMIVVVFLFASALVLLGSEQESYSETIQYFSSSLLASVDVKLLPELFTGERVLSRVYELDPNPDKGSFDDYQSQFTASVVHDDAVSVRVSGPDPAETQRLINIWLEIIDEDVLAPFRYSRQDILTTRIQEKLADYQAANQDYQDYYDEAGIEEKRQQFTELQILINNYSLQQVDLRLLMSSIQTLRKDLEEGDSPLSPANLLLLENILTGFSPDNLVIDTGEQLYSEKVLDSPPTRSEVLSLLTGLERYGESLIEFQVAEQSEASEQIAVLRMEVEQDPRLLELEELANFQKREYLNAVGELEDLSDEGYSVSYSWGEPELSMWEKLSIIHLAVIALAAILAAVFFLIVRDWWRQYL